jgi:hypothetical protein
MVDFRRANESDIEVDRAAVANAVEAERNRIAAEMRTDYCEMTEDMTAEDIDAIAASEAESKFADNFGLLATLDMTFVGITNKLGLPHKGDGEKTDAEWWLKFGDGTLASIYNYRNGPVARGGGDWKTRITRWHIGGRASQKQQIIRYMSELFPGGVVREVDLKAWVPDWPGALL